MSDNEKKINLPIKISLIDFFGILIPGFLMLLVLLFAFINFIYILPMLLCGNNSIFKDIISFFNAKNIEAISGYTIIGVFSLSYYLGSIIRLLSISATENLMEDIKKSFILKKLVNFKTPILDDDRFPYLKTLKYFHDDYNKELIDLFLLKFETYKDNNCQNKEIEKTCSDCTNNKYNEKTKKRRFCFYVKNTIFNKIKYEIIDNFPIKGKRIEEIESFIRFISGSFFVGCSLFIFNVTFLCLIISTNFLFNIGLDKYNCILIISNFLFLLFFLFLLLPGVASYFQNLRFKEVCNVFFSYCSIIENKINEEKYKETQRLDKYKNKELVHNV